VLDNTRVVLRAAYSIRQIMEGHAASFNGGEEIDSNPQLWAKVCRGIQQRDREETPPTADGTYLKPFRSFLERDNLDGQISKEVSYGKQT